MPTQAHLALLALKALATALMTQLFQEHLIALQTLQPSGHAFSTTPAEIQFEAFGIVSNTTCLAYQVGISTTTPAGTYSTSVIYTAVPLF